MQTHAFTRAKKYIHTPCHLHTQGIEFDEDLAALEEQFGTPRGQPGQWAACLRIVDPATLSTGKHSHIHLSTNSLSVCLSCISEHKQCLCNVLVCAGSLQSHGLLLFDVQLLQKMVCGGSARFVVLSLLLAESKETKEKEGKRRMLRFHVSCLHELGYLTRGVRLRNTLAKHQAQIDEPSTPRGVIWHPTRLSCLMSWDATLIGCACQATG